ncbi:MAG TPA: hypothetical protein PLH43_12080 [Acetivibrio sp.]|uniref:hypothetical protein n=1 Tax=Acetivibrio sp. TaxID=1872092 RepID=UPI002BD6062F|nr:hypothetical protein [Acetivibrio sp.]HOM03544.1 hypothetical protein [Acetivibrio sp.]HOT42502.1 hypothetical protein [Syntrophorhabdaceae bacterium]HQH43814.1 hypothetical protein [Syntrophorhabdaceae bacterium]
MEPKEYITNNTLKASTDKQMVDNTEKKDIVMKEATAKNVLMITPTGEMLTLDDLELKFCKEEIEDIEIGTLKRINVPDYKLPFKSVHPVVIRTPDSYYLRDGADLVKAAETDGLAFIRARVLYTDKSCSQALEISKIDSRLLSDNGDTIFAEKIRNISREIDILQKIPSIYMTKKQGGIQPNNDKIDILEHLAEKYHKKRSTMVNYRSYGIHIDDIAFNKIIEKDKKKEFFESIQARKTALIKELNKVKTPYDKITEIVSKHVLKWLMEEDEKKKAPPLSIEKKNSPQTSNQEDETPDNLIELMEEESETIEEETAYDDLENQKTPDDDIVNEQIGMDNILIKLKELSKKLALYSEAQETATVLERGIREIAQSLLDISIELNKIAEQTTIDMAIRKAM